MSEERSILRYLVGSRKTTLVSPDYVMKIVPKLSVERFIQKIEELIIDGNLNDAIKVLNALKYQDLFLIRGSLCQAEGIMSTKRIEQSIKAEVERTLRSNADSTGIKQAHEIYSAVSANLSYKDKLELQKNRTTIWIVDEATIRNLRGHIYRVMACRYIPAYKIQAIDGRKEGIWQFPECYIGVNINIARGGLAIGSNVFVVYPRSYIHPFVYVQSGKMCLGTGTTKVKNKMSKTSSTYRLIKLLLDAGEQVLKSGYNRPKKLIAPANGHIWDPKYDREKGYPKKISNSVTEEFKAMRKGYSTIKRKVKREEMRNG